MKPSFKLFVVLLALLLVSICVLCVSAQEDTQSGDGADAPPVPPLTDDDDDDDFGDDDDEDLHDPSQAFISAQDDIDERLSRITSHPDVEPFAFLPNNIDNTLELGKVSDMLLGFKNTGDYKFNVAAIRGFVVSPPEWTYPIQNLTGFGYNVSVHPEETTTLLYRFMPSEMLSAREFGIVVEVFYNNERNSTFMTTFFNQTVTFTEPEENFGIQSLVSLVTLLALIAGGGYIAYYFYAPKSLKDSVNTQISGMGINVLGSQGAKSSSTSSPSEDSPTDNSINESWIPAHLKSMHKKSSKKSLK